MAATVTLLPPSGSDSNTIYQITGYPISPIQVSKSNLQQDLIEFIVSVIPTGSVLVNPMTTLGDMIYGVGGGTPTRLPGYTANSTGLLNQTGNGTISAAPTWTLPASIPGLPRLGLDANATALRAAPGINGQLGIAIDGYCAISNGTNWTTTPFNFGPTVYFGGLPGTSAFISEPAPRTDGGYCNFLQATQIAPSGAIPIDNALKILNTTDNGAGTVGYASVTLGRSDGTAAGGTYFTMGTIGKPNGTGNDYLTGGFIATNPLLASALGTPMPFGLYQEKLGGSNYFQARRIYFDASLGITAYGITDSQQVGPIAWYVATSGIVVIGGNTVSGTSALQTPTISIGGATVVLGGNFTISGAFTTTLTVTANTSVTLPTSGTLMANPLTTLGDIIYENATPAPARLVGNTTTTQQILTQTGNGTISAAPAWATPNAISGLPLMNNQGRAGMVGSSFNVGQWWFANDGTFGYWNGSNATSPVNLYYGAFIGAGGTVAVSTVLKTSNTGQIASATKGTDYLFAIQATNGSGVTLLGANAPAAIGTVSAPTQWLAMTLPDGTTGYIPVWK